MSEPSSVSLASTVVGFISFAFTVLTLLRVTWNSLESLVEAPSEIKFAFANLKSALHEEREYLRRTGRMGRRRRSHSGARNRDKGGGAKHRSSYSEQAKMNLDTKDGVAQWRVISDTVKKLCQQFKEVERPFLTDAAAKSLSSIDEEKGGWVDDEKEYVIEGYINDYSDMTLSHRFLWLRKKGQVNNIRDGLLRVQIRRMSQEVTGTLLRLSALEGDLKDLRLIPRPSSSGSDGADRHDGYRTERVHVRRTRHD